MRDATKSGFAAGRAVTAGLVTILLLAGPVLPAAARTREQRLLREPPVIEGEPVAGAAERLQLANAESEYPVTPGDTYRLSYLRAGAIVSTEVTVENDYTINLSIFGRYNAEGYTSAELKPRIVQIVEQAIPGSLPAVTLTAVGVFQVRLTGELAQSRSVIAWGLSRLSEVVRNRLAPYSSIRNVTIVSRAGEREEYDLFRAIDLGDETQDPHVRPGDTIRLERAGRLVYVGGEVNQSGRIELAENETIRDLPRFVRGATSQGDLSRVRVTRTEEETVRTYFLDLTDEGLDFALKDGDVVNVPSRVTQRPVVYLEGQISLPGEAEDDADTLVDTAPGYNRAVVPIGLGETLYGVLDRMYAGISPRADLGRAQLLRNGRPVELAVSFEVLIYNYRPEYDVELESFDRIVIPRDPSTPPDGEPSVLITGGVNAPGQYPVLAGMDAYAHIRQAGGFNRELNTNERFRVYDAEGKRKGEEEPIEAGDHIEVLRNNFVYNFNRHFPIIATGVGFLATIVATLAIFGP